MQEKSSYSLSNEESKRISILKFISIILVVYIHSYNTGMNFSDGNISLLLPNWLKLFEDFLSQGIARMAVPLFFLFSSVLLFKREHNYWELLKQKSKRLIIPYFFWNAVWILIYFVFQSFEFTKPYFSNPDNIVADFQIFDWMRAFGISLYSVPFLYPFWFIRDLIVMLICYPLFKKLIDFSPKISLFIAVILLICPAIIPCQTAITFFLFGGFIVKSNLHFKVIDKVNFWILCIIYSIVLIFKITVNHYLIANLAIIIGVLFFLKFSKYLYENNTSNKTLEKLTPYTFIIYAGHEVMLSIFKKIMLRYLPHTDLLLFFQYFVLPIIVIIICIIFGFILKKFFLPIYSFVTGE